MRSLLLAIAASGSSAGGASDHADLAAIDAQVAVFTGAPIGAVGGAITPLDRRLRLAPCQSGLALSWRMPRKDSVVVQCGDRGGWRLFVPVRRALAEPAPAPARPPDAIRRGDAVSIAVSGAGFTVSQPGEALEAGPVGGWIRVRPASARRGRSEDMHAQIVRPGLVRVPLP